MIWPLALKRVMTMKRQYVIVVALFYGLVVSLEAQAPKPRPQPKEPPARSAAPSRSATLVVETDLTCLLTIDGEDKGRLAAGGTTKVAINQGEHIVRCASADDAEVVWRKTIEITGTQTRVAAVELKALLEAKRRNDKATRGGDSKGTLNGAAATFEKARSTLDDVQAASLFLEACEGGHAAACGELGRRSERGRGIAKDEPRAAVLYQRACDARDFTACNSLGILYAFGSGVAKDEMRATTLYQRACDGGHYTGCSNLAIMYANGLGVAKDETRAATLNQRACDGSAGECNNLGAAYATGRGVVKDETRAATLFQRACDGGSYIGCNNIGAAYANGRGVAKDEKRAAGLYQRACDGGWAFGCNSLGLMYANGRGMLKDETRAATFFRRACDGGNASGCNNLGYMLAEQGESLDESVSLITKARQLDPDNALYLGSLGWAYYKADKLDLAEANLKRAAEQLTTSSVVQDHFGDVLFRLRRYEDAVAAWTRALGGDGQSIDSVRINEKIRTAREQRAEN